MSFLHLLEKDCAKLIMSNALMDTMKAVEDDKLFSLTEHCASLDFYSRVGAAMSTAGIRISAHTYKVVCLHVTGSSQQEIADELKMKRQTQISDVLTDFRALLLHQQARIAAKYPLLAVVAKASTSSSMLKYARINMGQFMELLHDLKEGKL